MLSAALVANCIAYGSVTQQPSTAALVYSGTSAKVYRAGNVIGFTAGGTPLLESGSIASRFSNSGVATMAAGSTTVLVNHGLFAQPNLGDINVTPSKTWGNITKWWISLPTATTFTINANLSPGVSVDFAWGAKVPSLDG